ncbi:phytanoyl-CoA hydroxylase-interacting protein-like isoform X2 [Mizuhopecten yessoensis]|uniref:phytanoyl-CoA hydroxylase-interacting protein-like isoform X2 n=1 Tax=Mizuhopecten yessoensis TaxID=6573 RepID=UPI000B45BE47|nr:phytanoyl-CoA hydroxylase-interacting protein-like isoform X2 [Mizuhopecten yessoensis]XP_021365850.1 phytanoyl-CoA hydroxylase-interacting protein-like isoform X2 [Mizuhopecten yessoensis]
MVQNNKHWQHDGNYEDDEVSRFILRSHVGKNKLPFLIDIKRTKELQPDFLFLQVFNSKSQLIFHSFSRPSQCRLFTCPDDVLRRSLATVTVYGVKTLNTDTGVAYHILMGGKASMNLTRGATIDYIMIAMRPLTTYLDLLTDAPNKVAYHVDAVCIGPMRYMLTDLHHRGEHTDTFIITLYQVHPPSACIMFYYGSETEYEIPLCLKPVSEYKLQLFRVNTRHVTDDVYKFIGNSHSTVTAFNTYMTQAEVVELYNKAVHFVSRRPPYSSYLSHFYRNKSEEYFNNIMRTDGVMHKYDKNWGGDQASTLNKQVQGLFFSAVVDQVTRLLPDFSFFGPRRLHVPTYLLLNNNMNMYFSDFYCHRVNHKVQFVLTVKGSPTDHFCRKRLVLVDQTNNPFLTRVRCGFTEIVRVTMNVTVEVFYTEDVPAKAWMCHDNVFFTTTKQMGNALDMVNGIPKNIKCQICNLDCFLLAETLKA